MTTQDCADILNALAGERIFDDRMIRQRVEDGELACVNPHRGRRERAIITARDFCAYVAKRHPQYLEDVRERLNIAA